jgi:agmatinase
MSESSPEYNFCGLTKEYSAKEKSKFQILPIPYEATTSYGQGTILGPKAIIDASLYMETYDEELKQETYKLGIHTLPAIEPVGSGPKDMVNTIADSVYKEISSYKNNNKLLIGLGGEHSISPGIVKAFKKKYSDLTVLHFDAHADLRDSFHGTPHSHACAVRRILEHCPAVSCGIRSLSVEEAEFAEKTNKNIFFYREAFDRIKQIKSLLSDNVFITLDIDVLDPSIMPATGTPEPDGWLWRDLCNFLKDIIASKNIVGMDLVELAPIPGNNAPNFTTAKLLYRIMGYIAQSKKWIKSKK